jgi:hypothetical protein
MGMKGNGWIVTSNPASPILGYTDTETVKLDVDDTTFRYVKYWAMIALHKFRLQGVLLLKSSPRCYHVVFNRTVTWSENLRIVAWVSLVAHNMSLLKWLQMQCIKQSSTLRVSRKSVKPAPRIVFRYGRDDAQIHQFLRYRRMLKQMIRKNRCSSTVVS